MHYCHSRNPFLLLLNFIWDIFGWKSNAIGLDKRKECRKCMWKGVKDNKSTWNVFCHCIKPLKNPFVGFFLIKSKHSWYTLIKCLPTQFHPFWVTNFPLYLWVIVAVVVIIIIFTNRRTILKVYTTELVPQSTYFSMNLIHIMDFISMFFVYLRWNTKVE